MGRTLLLVTGAGRSGTSTAAGTLHHLGVHVPGPYLDANPSNPRGFYESRWSVEFHNRLLKRAYVSQTDGRPDAAALVRAALGDREREALAAWVAEHTHGRPVTAVKDPRTSWTIDLWSSVAADEGLRMCFLAMLRHPAEVVGSRATHYSSGVAALGERGFTARNLAGWVNAVLTIERQTRGRSRSFLRYDDLLSDWRSAMAGIATDLDLDLDMPGRTIPHPVDDFIDPALSRHRLGWDDVDAPPALSAVAQEVWAATSRLADTHGEDSEVQQRLDQAGAEYRRMYHDAEQLIYDSTAAQVSQARRAARRQARREAQREASGRRGARTWVARLRRRVTR